MSEDTTSVAKEFHKVINMAPEELESWLSTDESRTVGQKDSEEAESTGHKSGRHIVKLLQSKSADYSEDDLPQMKRVISYVHRHGAQRPSGDIEHTRWRYSLMNWGHDPLK
ncbi:MAG: DUF3140 domain-containing protein [Gemmatimonadaceae bacterium]|nr:DUF3140 domain-containing protein [Gloeobacterales cyanobacterium ES-bin-141]